MRHFFLMFFLLTQLLYSQPPEPITREYVQQLVALHSSEDESLAEYVKQFSLEKYEIVESRALGKFIVEQDTQDDIKNIIREGWHREQHVWRALMAHVKPGTTAIDIGAHIGTHTRALSFAVGPIGTVHVFEPQLKLFTELLINMQFHEQPDNIIYHRAALGDYCGEIEMNPAYGCEGCVSVGKGGDKAPIFRLDDFNLDNISVMKIDVEGMEEAVIRGAIKTIERNRPVIVIEIMGGVGYGTAAPETKTEIERRLRIIEELGYSIEYLAISDFLCVPLN